ncbi:MAG: hypothetical protein HYR88_04120 [Verrucomicrobia bacterium]|nr:hypothetical protein [Verrucomicrobiota bacterium]MBI3866941.1 hypothetical protein [Verrucomicrobiota bacterium]
MKALSLNSALVLLLWMVLSPAGGRAADRFRTDINPALLYWQAWAEIPTLSEPDQGYLFTNEWRGHKLEQKFGDLVGRYDVSFKLLYRASKAKVPCEWGYDLTDGPEALLPGLAKAKTLAQAARLRALWRLQNGTQDTAVEDLVSAFAQGRLLSEDRILISALVQYAIENICVNTVAENYHRFSSEALERLRSGLLASAPRGSTAACIPTEKVAFHGWLLRRVEDFRRESSDESQVLGQIRDLLTRVMDSPGATDPEKAKRILKAAGETVSGFVRYVSELGPLYDELESIMASPVGEFESRMKPFEKKVSGHPNLLVKEFFSPLANCRRKELSAEIKVAMLEAAIAQRRGGEAARQGILDPFSKKPFAYRRFMFEGVDRGFELKSDYSYAGFNGLMVFVEKDGPAFHTTGDQVGKRVE